MVPLLYKPQTWIAWQPRVRGIPTLLLPAQFVLPVDLPLVLTLMEVLHDQGKLTSEQDQFMAETRPVEEFYDLESDPYELNNLIEHSDLQDQVARLKHELDQWIHQTGDMGAIPESEEIATAWDQQMANQFSK